MIYTIQRTEQPPSPDAPFDGPAWAGAETLEIAHFSEQGSDHRPVTRAKVLYDDKGLHVAFHVRDRYVRCVQQGFQPPVCRDSCMEFFVEPVAGKGYTNFEVSCGGHLLLHYNVVRGDTIDRTVMSEAECARVRIAHSLPEQVDPERAEPTDWQVAYFAPFSLFTPYVGEVRPGPGDTWRANFYKCADECSHPHWGMWSPITGKLSFHQPQFFGEVRFA
jgi:hypothetical protein